MVGGLFNEHTTWIRVGSGQRRRGYGAPLDRWIRGCSSESAPRYHACKTATQYDEMSKTTFGLVDKCFYQGISEGWAAEDAPADGAAFRSQTGRPA